MSDQKTVANVVRNATTHNNKGDLYSSFNVEDFDIPGGRDEVWRFVSLRRLRGLHNGQFAPQAPAQITVDAPSEVTVEQVALDDDRVTAAGAPVDRIAAQAWTSSENATLVSVPANVELNDTITITVTGAGADVTTFGTIVVETGANSGATVLVRYEGSGTHADNVNWVIGEGSRVNAVIDANWDLDAVHVGQQAIVVKRDATLRHHVATFGGEVVRISPRVSFEAPGGDAELTGVYFADAGQYIENRLLVDHGVPNCRSNVLYKGALQGDKASGLPEARTCWVGDVLIRAEAQGTDTYETNRNLVLTDGARADAIPNLEIETGEIAGAGHAATVGRFDDDQLFYLRSRGIREEDATRLIIRGFFNEVLNQIPIESVREDLIARVAGELERNEN
ncbi:Fe-S cluster assembly protein SufD [Corynebacterium coyleae]|uniref:Fe-S cluster assembly protein SufD n=1 Tax=Corynebacterium coyleae TaxID=53374 RepID=UPI000C769293|nr:Fe-S cluster assembly protein SufD [Corynebacterium coyleae]MDK8663051.1 Fe-S cluster assembly protein SufD [Corynebacterium coyleae]MDK8705903.1 Fe-S cluster assembly protein SufD [Corynebacterium coyleae]MDK8733010.1 Fe-S cluster assembly protein SufD [Corynebacterium coyleae]MDK8891944.1 Fe-S cluster assembly protein SufD [Corynebacterium coyleae]PLA28564.1 Fe-S cluster assembly protein SufD [Corynebacterium coyleae]